MNELVIILLRGWTAWIQIRNSMRTTVRQQPCEGTLTGGLHCARSAFVRNNLHVPREEHDIYGFAFTLFLLRQSADAPAPLLFFTNGATTDYLPLKPAFVPVFLHKICICHPTSVFRLQFSSFTGCLCRKNSSGAVCCGAWFSTVPDNVTLSAMEAASPNYI